jgi:hypothetical protein
MKKQPPEGKGIRQTLSKPPSSRAGPDATLIYDDVQHLRRLHWTNKRGLRGIHRHPKTRLPHHEATGTKLTVRPRWRGCGALRTLLPEDHLPLAKFSFTGHSTHKAPYPMFSPLRPPRAGQSEHRS